MRRLSSGLALAEKRRLFRLHLGRAGRAAGYGQSERERAAQLRISEVDRKSWRLRNSILESSAPAASAKSTPKQLLFGFLKPCWPRLRILITQLQKTLRASAEF